MTRLVALSGGKDSTALALRLAEVEPADYTYFVTPTGDELPDVIEHWSRLETLLDKPLLRVKAPTLRQTVDAMQMLPNYRARFCTRLIKIAPARDWMATLGPCVLNVGLRADEAERVGMVEPPENVTLRFPLREWGWGLDEVWAYLGKRGVSVPRRTDCARCFFQRLGEWWRLWKKYPAIYDDAVQDEVRLGHTYRTPGRDTWPTALADLRAEFASGRVPGQADQEVLFTDAEVCHVCRA